jgi:hypothetical protein
MRVLALCSVSALGGALFLNAADSAVAPVAQANEETPADIIAVQVRKQGFPCGKAQSASRDPKISKADEPAWTLTCDNATYRVRLVGNMADHIEKLDQKSSSSAPGVSR